MDEELSLLNTLEGLNLADEALSENKNAILIFEQTGDLEIRTYRDCSALMTHHGWLEQAALYQ